MEQPALVVNRPPAPNPAPQVKKPVKAIVSPITTPAAPPRPKRHVTIDELRQTMTKWLSIPAEDADLVDFCLAIYISHRIPGDPLWGILIDASGGGKTELLRSLRKRPDAYFLSKITEHSLVSGFRDPKKPNDDPSILPKLNEKVLIIKDLAPLLSMRREARNSIIADLRDAYDGFTDHGRGNVGKVAYEARFSLITAATLAIERVDTVEQELGERFIKIRSRGDGSRDKVRRAISNIGADNPMRNEIEETISDFLDSVPKVANLTIPDALRERLIALSDFCAKGRSTVARDRHGDLQYHGKPEVGTRLGKELGKLLIALAAVRGKPCPDEADFATVTRVAEDCLPPNRLLVVKALRSGPRRLAEIERAADLPHKTTIRALDDLRLLGLVERHEVTDENATVAASEPMVVWSLVSD